MARSETLINPDIFILVGEHSGDAQGHTLLQTLYNIHPHLTIAGVAGPKMRTLPIHVITEMESLNVMGFTDVISSLPRIFSIYRKIKKWILKHKPKLIILFDYAEFNLLLAKNLKKAGISSKIVQYVCPSVWAWRQSRMKTMIRSLDYLVCLFPFESKLFSTTSLESGFFGHPLAAPSLLNTGATFNLPTKKPILSLFPGSRQREIDNNLPLQMKVAHEVANHSHHIVISCAHQRFETTISRICSSYDSSTYTILPSIYNNAIMHQSDLTIATSGTINLELAFHSVPTIVTYFVSSFDYFLATKIFNIHLDHYCIVNINANKTLFPELYGPNFNAITLSNTLKQLIYDETLKSKIREECLLLSEELHLADGSLKCAKKLLSLISYAP